MKEFNIFTGSISEEIRNAKPGIPTEKPQRRELPETKPPLKIPTPEPTPVPEPVPTKEPIKTPPAPVPVGKI